MWPPIETGGGTAIYCAGQSYPKVKYCTFKNLNNSVAIACGEAISGIILQQDTINYPSPYIYKCNIMPSVGGFWLPHLSDYDNVILNGGFLDNCYLGISNYEADVTLGTPIDTIGDGICNTTSTNTIKPRFINIDGVVNPQKSL